MSFLCANKILYQLYNNLPKTMKLLQENDVRINFILNYGELINGYIGLEKIDEVYTSLDMIESERTLRILNKRHIKPSIFLQNNFYENLSYKLEELVYPCEIAKIISNNSEHGKLCQIYKVYANPHLLSNRDFDMPINQNKEEIIIERKIKLITLSKFNGKVDDFALSDQIIETYFKMNVPMDLRKNICTFYELFQNNKLNESIVTYRRIEKDYNYEKFRDQEFKKYFKMAQIKIKNMISLGYKGKDEDNFTILVDIA